MNSFIQLIKKGLNHTNFAFYKSLRMSLFNRKPLLCDLFDDLTDNYCEAEKLLGNTIWLGCIYMFTYDQKIKSEYKDKVTFIDPAPMVLITQQDKDFIRGINLNLCTPELRILILNIITNLDEPFYNGGFVDMCNNKKVPLSQKTMKFISKDGEKQIINALKKHFDKVDYGTIFRTYRKARIGSIRFIEYYIWPYLPQLEFTGIPANVMKEYWKLSKIDTIKI